MADEPDAVKRLFESYQSTWVATRDGKQIASFYHAPCLTLRGDGTFVCFSTVDEVTEFFQSAADTYYRQGWERIAFKDLSTELLGSRSVFATMTWQAWKGNPTTSAGSARSGRLCSQHSTSVASLLLR
jgi:hypothetical protein